MKALARRIRATHLFGQLSTDQLITLLSQSDITYADAGDIILKEHEPNNYHIFLLEGELEAQKTWQVPNSHDKSYTWNLQSSGQEGEFAYLGTSMRIRVRAITDLKYIPVSADAVDIMTGWSQQIHNVIEGDDELKALFNVVRNASVFHKLPLENIKTALHKLKPMQVQAGQTIIKQGDMGDSYYIIQSGNAKVYQVDPFSAETCLVNQLGPGDFFGEEALVQEGFRSATVIMATPGKLYYLAREDFKELIIPGLVSEISAVHANQLIIEGKAKWLDCRYEIEYEDSRLPGAPLIPVDRIRHETHKLDVDTKYIVYCRSGRRSKAAAFLLRERNIDAISLAGGIKNWPYDIDMGPITASIANEPKQDQQPA